MKKKASRLRWLAVDKARVFTKAGQPKQEKSLTLYIKTILIVA